MGGPSLSPPYGEHEHYRITQPKSSTRFAHLNPGAGIYPFRWIEDRRRTLNDKQQARSAERSRISDWWQH